jgi:drug/metabolite transporter (DMT)-like permease
MPNRATTLQVWIALVAVYLAWGSTYLGIAIGVETIPPFLMAAARFALAGGALVTWELIRAGRTLRLPSARELRDSAIVGLLLLGIANGFVGLAEQTVPSSIAAIFIALTPAWFAVLGRLYFGDATPRVVVAGVGLGFAGIVLLVWPLGATGGAFDLAGIAVLVVAPLAWAHGSLYAARRATLPSRPLMASGLQMLAGSAALLAEALVTGEPGRFRLEVVSASSIAAVAYLAVVGSLIGYNAYAWLLRSAPLSLVSTYAYVNPIVAVALGTLILAEPLAPRTLVASAITIAAVALIVTARSRNVRPAPPVLETEAGPDSRTHPAPDPPGASDEPGSVGPLNPTPSPRP